VAKINLKSSHITPFGRRSGEFASVILEAVRPVLESTDPGAIRHIYIGNYAAAELCDISDPFRLVTRSIQSAFPGLRATSHGLYKTGAHALIAALDAMPADPAGGSGSVLVVGGEKMTDRPASEAGGLLSQRENPHDRSYGATLPALGGLVTRAYMERHRIPARALHHVAVKSHGYGALNPNAHFRNTVSADEVASSPVVADPLRRLHCAPMSDGAAAILLGSTGGDVSFRGWAKGTDTPTFQDRADVTRFAASAAAAREAFAAAGVQPGDVDVVEIHDAFSSFELINFEEMGFAERGGAWRALLDGDFGPDGTVSINPSGGMKARGHPIGACGLSSVAEIHDQLTGTAGSRQRSGARVGAIQSVGGVSDESFVFVLEAND